MKVMSSFKAIILLLVVSFSANSNAGLIEVDDWWLQTDNLGGLRQSTTNSDYYFAVSKTNVWSVSDNYEAIDGYRVATTAEGLSVFNQNNFSGDHTYYNQGGWSGYNWAGTNRYFFRFSDSDVTNAYKHAGNFDEYHVQYSGHTSFAGLVLIKEASVPEPMPIALLGLGLFLMGGIRRSKSRVVLS